MKTVKKYTTFEDLKSIGKKSVDNNASLKKRNEFEKVIMSIYAAKTDKTQVHQSK